MVIALAGEGMVGVTPGIGEGVGSLDEICKTVAVPVSGDGFAVPG